MRINALGSSPNAKSFQKSSVTRSESLVLPALGSAPTPIYINNFNRLTTTRQMCEYLDNVADVRAVIIDNASTYGPLLDWYEHGGRSVVRLSNNLGHLAPWSSGIVSKTATPYYVVTDSDLDLEGCPTDLMSVLWDGLSRYPTRSKAGLSLEIDDLPPSPQRNRVVQFESKYWHRRLDSRFFDAGVDTTFALYLTGRARVAPRTYGNAIRSDRPYTARHVPWYSTPGNFSEEENYYLKTASPKVSTMAGWTNRGKTLGG